MEYKDYYKILGVSKSASEKDIKSAYRKLARKYHPDVNPGDKSAEEKFKEINEAQAVLTDPEKRQKYDTVGPDWEKRFQQYRPGGAGRTQAGTTSAADFSDFFDTLFGQRGGQTTKPGGFDFDLGSIFGRGQQRRTEASQRGLDVEQAIDITLREAFAGVERAFTVQVPQTCPTCHGSGLVNDELCPSCHGATTVTRVRRIEVKIPAGVREGSRVRVAGEGNPGTPAGDLYLVTHIIPDGTFRREGNDIYTEVNIPVSILALGGEVDVATLNGRVTMRVPAGSQNGRTMRLSGQGMPSLKGGDRGDFYVKLYARLPSSLSEEQRAIFEQLQKTGA